MICVKNEIDAMRSKDPKEEMYQIDTLVGNLMMA